MQEAKKLHPNNPSVFFFQVNKRSSGQMSHIVKTVQDSIEAYWRKSKS